MPGDLGWKSVELQLEALIPGILLLIELDLVAVGYLGHSLLAGLALPTNAFVRVATFVAASYSVGAVSSLVTRAIVDRISEAGSRAFLFWLFAHVDIETLIKELKRLDRKRFEQDLKSEQTRRWSQRAGRWNAAYRAAVRSSSRRDEVDRRRSQGRLVRNLFFVAGLAPFAVYQGTQSRVLLSLLAALAAIVLYGYSEYVIFAEAYDISTSRLAAKAKDSHSPTPAQKEP